MCSCDGDTMQDETVEYSPELSLGYGLTLLMGTHEYIFIFF